MLWVEEEVIHSIELWVGRGGNLLHLVRGWRRRSFTQLSYGWEKEVIHYIKLGVGGGGNSLRGGGH